MKTEWKDVDVELRVLIVLFGLFVVLPLFWIGLLSLAAWSVGMFEVMGWCGCPH